MTTTQPMSRQDVLDARKASSVVVRLQALSDEFGEVASYYAEGFESEHYRLLHAAALRAALQLWKVSELVVSGEYSQQQGADWLKAGWRIITAIGRENVR